MLKIKYELFFVCLLGKLRVGATIYLVVNRRVCFWFCSVFTLPPTRGVFRSVGQLMKGLCHAWRGDLIGSGHCFGIACSNMSWVKCAVKIGCWMGICGININID